MTRTVHELRNDIRRAVGRFERETSTGFTKEDLAAICGAVTDAFDGDTLPPTAEMRAEILQHVEGTDEVDADEVTRSFRKAELEAIAAAVTDQ